MTAADATRRDLRDGWTPDPPEPTEHEQYAAWLESEADNYDDDGEEDDA